MDSEKDVLQALNPLTEQERLDARDRARALVARKYPKPERVQYDTAGLQPRREQFEESHISEFPKWVTRSIGVMLLIAFAGAFATSAFSVFSAGRDHYLSAMTSGAGIGWQAVVVGVAIVLLAEFLTITSVLAARIYFRQKRGWQLGMVLPAAAGVVIAVTANAVVAQPHNYWEWLVTAAPPVSVIFLAVIGEQIILVDVKRSHQNETAYQQAVADWKKADRVDDETYTQAVRKWEKEVSDPEKTSVWPVTYANQLRQMIRRVNGRGRGRTEREDLMAAMTPGQWNEVVWREMDADNWFVNDNVNVDRPQHKRVDKAKKARKKSTVNETVNTVVNETVNDDALTWDDLRPAAQEIVVHLRGNPADKELTARKLAEKTGVNHTSCSRALRFVNQEPALTSAVVKSNGHSVS